VNAEEPKVMLLEANGHGRVYVNGETRGGDVYQYGYVSLPVALKQGENRFLFALGRGELRAQLLDPPAPLSFDLRDATTPDVVVGRTETAWAGINLRNAQSTRLESATLEAVSSKGAVIESKVGPIDALTTRKVGVRLRLDGSESYTLRVKTRGETVHTDTLNLRLRQPDQAHKVTFLSDIDGSVQYYGVQPSSNPGGGQALFLSLHGASVEAIGQAEAEHDWSVWQNPRHGNPVRQLCKQVQSAKHVLSELLQNADDAGASSAEATLIGSTFAFHHNGQDFDQEQFASLCRFAYSNKRTIHTIGFRGIGFKSTFSLGDVVYVETPTLRVLFREETFTLPEWIKDGQTVCGTRITVSNVDANVEGDLSANFEQWGAEPYSLLFLKNLRRLTLPSCDIHWEPDEQSHFQVGQWYKTASVSDPVLLCRSEAQHFPAECLDEIRQERNLDDADIAEFPPCSVELVVGAPGRLYVVLPTGIELDLGFGVNAPFIQDPARYGIKPLSTSPTNRWLLERVGVFAAEAMLRWLADTELSQLDRAGAYALMPSGMLRF
jgi:hypothetical protein